MSEEELVSGCLDGKKRCFDTLYDNYASMLYAVCRRYADDEDTARDFMQEGFIRIFKNLKSFDRSKGTLGVWLKRVVINLCIDSIRKKKHTQSTVFIDEISDSYTEVEENSFEEYSNLTYDDIVIAIASLPAGYRTVFNLYVIDQKSHKEIAEMLSISESTSKTQLMKARLQLQKSLKSLPVYKVSEQ